MEIRQQSPVIDRQPNGWYRQHSLANVLRMGHCAPAVMQTLMDIAAPGQEWLVRLSAGMPGGIGNTGFECGALTSPLALLGLHHGLGEIDGALPVVFDQGHALYRHFLECHQTVQCKEIRKNDSFPRHCFRPILLSPELYLDATTGTARDAIPGEAREAYGRLYAHMAQNGFHCAQAVFDRLGYTLPNHQELYDAASAFMGGTLFLGMTCSAFTAGVMAIGLRGGEIENSIWRVFRMIVIMSTGGNAFDESINKFNRSMNRAYRMSQWFRSEFGSTQCQSITQCNFSSPAGVRKYIESNCLEGCRKITEKVAEWVPLILQQ